MAKKCGADIVLNPSKCDVLKEVKALSDGYGCDVYIEATGNPASVKQGCGHKLVTFLLVCLKQFNTCLPYSALFLRS